MRRASDTGRKKTGFFSSDSDDTVCDRILLESMRVCPSCGSRTSSGAGGGGCRSGRGCP